jgi:hypothetical protein
MYLPHSQAGHGAVLASAPELCLQMFSLPHLTPRSSAARAFKDCPTCAQGSVRLTVDTTHGERVCGVSMRQIKDLEILESF